MARLQTWRFRECWVPLLIGPSWPGVIAPDRILFMGQIEKYCIQTNDKWLMLNCDCYLAILEYLQIIYILNIYVHRGFGAK